MKQLSPRQAFYSSVIRAVLTLVVLAVLGAIVTRLPMLQELWVKEVSMSGTDIARVVISLVMVGVLLSFAHTLGAQLPIVVPRFPQSGPLTASIVHIIAIVITYNALFSIAAPLLLKDIWIFQVAFLLLLCYPLYRGGRAFYKGIDEVTEFFTTRVGMATGESVKCPSCGAVSEASAEFCAQCGTKLAPPAVPKAIVCPQCGAESEASAKFCAQCGTTLTPPTAPKAIVCPQCGAENKPQARYCTTCGAELSRGT